MSVSNDISKLLEENKKLLQQAKKTTCKRCGEKVKPGSTYCEKCQNEKQEEAEKKRAGKPAGKSEGGYKYAYDKNGRLRVAARIVMEEVLGRPLLEHELVSYRDGNKENLDPSNLIVLWKTGTPLDFFTCKSCGARGNMIVSGPAEAV